MNSLLLFKELLVILNMKDSRYSIKDLENLTKIKAHTIRIWEQRYGILNPQRTPTNIRYYVDSDLRKILNVNLLYTNGYKISKIAQLREEEIVQEVKKLLGNDSGRFADIINDVVKSIMKLDEKRIRQTLTENLEEHNMFVLYNEIIQPILKRIGELWQLNTLSIGHEHFFSAILRNFIIEETEKLSIKSNGKSLLLFLHAEEEHEITLLLYNYLFKKNGYKTYYLGQNMPMSDLYVIFEQLDPDLIITNFIMYISEDTFKEVCEDLIHKLDKKQVVFSGAQAVQYKKLIPEGITLIESQKDLENYFV